MTKNKFNKNKFNKNKEEIIYNIVNSLIAGSLVLAGSVVDGTITKTGLMAALAASVIVAIAKFKDYWESEKPEYCKNLLNFV